MMQTNVNLKDLLIRIGALLEGEKDEVAALATVACELHHGLTTDWTGFYRVTEPELLTVGPYQGGHGCLHFPFSKGVCGEAARTKYRVLVKNVHEHSDHIACSSSTLSELVVPVFNAQQEVVAVLDLDSNEEDFFTQEHLEFAETVCRTLSRFYN